MMTFARKVMSTQLRVSIRPLVTEGKRQNCSRRNC